MLEHRWVHRPGFPDFVLAVVALGGEPTRDDAVATFRTGAADTEHSGELAAGRLVAPMASSGFDVAGLAVAPPDAARASGAEDRAARQQAEREDRVDRLRAEADRARERAELLAREADEARRRAEDLQEQAADAARRAEDAQRRLDRAT